MRKGNLCWLLLSLVVILIDLWTKAWIKTKLFLGMSYALLPVLNFTLAYNRGAAFSFLNGAGGWQQWMFSLLAIVVSAGLVAWLYRMKRKNNLQAACAALIIGGAIGNVISRLYYGYVVDFIDFHIGNWHWPAFNIADSAIFIGVFLLIVDAFIKK